MGYGDIDFLEWRGEEIEFISAMPSSDIAGCLLTVHGHQRGSRTGARGALTEKMARYLTQHGWMAAGVSQPGYGGSSGPPDMCGPRTQAAIEAAYSHLLNKGAKPDKTIVWGVSRGAIASACAFRSISAEPALLILQSGIYDMSGWIDWINNNAPGGDEELSKSILSNLYLEAGTSDSAFAERSGINFVEDNTCDVLLVHGEKDDRIPVSQAEAMRDALSACGRRVCLAVEPEGGHNLTKGFAMRSARKFRPDLQIP